MPALRALIEPEPQAGQAADDAQYYRRVLHKLIDQGAGLADLVQESAQANPATAPAAIIAFDRIARTVRRTIALARKVAEPVPTRATKLTDHRAAARRRIIRGVEDVLQREAKGAAAESLHEELLDRLDRPEIEDDIGHRPVADIIADICHDLGLGAPPGAHPWKRRTPSDIAALCARAAAKPIAAAQSSPNPAIIPHDVARPAASVPATSRAPPPTASG